MTENTLIDILKRNQEPNEKQNKTDVISDLIKQISDTSIEPREKMYVDMGRMLFDLEKIKMISRLDKRMIYYFIVNYIALYFYFDFYRKFKYKIVFTVKLKKERCNHLNGLITAQECPLCQGSGEYIDERLVSKDIINKKDLENMQKLIDKYEILLNDILQLFISEQGKGRDEVIRILNGINEELRQSMLGKISGFMGKNVRDVENI